VVVVLAVVVVVVVVVLVVFVYDDTEIFDLSSDVLVRSPCSLPAACKCGF
jgi:hypothetical protein